MVRDGETPDRQEQVFDLLMEAERLQGSAREALLAMSAPDLAEEVRTLLEQLGSGASRILGPRPTDLAEAFVPEVGATLGSYCLVESLGVGGMGQVFLADDLDTPGRQVAIKLLRHRVVPAKHRQRFQREQKAMEQLAHRNVGRILDADTTIDGEPYLVMERIDGAPITSYCDNHRLSIDQRLRLFLHVCRGVAHAHRRHLLHRDIKPSNVLVAEIDGRSVAKLIDFGLAKAVDASVETGFSATGVVGTPTHMSPEALHGDKALDARTDVFSLGVLLHVLLTGQLPWVEPATRPVNPFTAHFARSSRQPSEQLEQLDVEMLETVASRRGSTPQQLLRRLRGDLDAIVGRAIESDRGHRYATVDTLRADLKRHLRAKPVRARPRTPGYVLSRALLRHQRTITRAVRRLLPRHRTR
ncbi:MAG: serine/threonine-protein kinase [Acidobacteriota bacterium]